MKNLNKNLIAMTGIISLGITGQQSEAKFKKEASPQRPNILLIFIDDMGYADLGCYGNTEVQTPNIDKLANEGILFTQFYVNSPICSPSRTAITTGQYPSRWGITSYINGRKANANREILKYNLLNWAKVKFTGKNEISSQKFLLTGR